MRKIALQSFDEIPDEKRRSRVPLILFTLFLTLGLAPLALEGVSVILGNWKECLGVSAQVRTPVMDSIQETVDNVQTEFWLEVAPYARRLPWDPRMVLPASALIMAVAMLMLRR